MIKYSTRDFHYFQKKICLASTMYLVQKVSPYLKNDSYILSFGCKFVFLQHYSSHQYRACADSRSSRSSAAVTAHVGCVLRSECLVSSIHLMSINHFTDFLLYSLQRVQNFMMMMMEDPQETNQEEIIDLTTNEEVNKVKSKV